VFGPEGWPVEAEESTPFEDPVDDRIGEIVIMQDVAPAPWMLVGGEDHGPSVDVAVVDDVVEDVGGVVAVGEVDLLPSSGPSIPI
jgi:hypothetical protein